MKTEHTPGPWFLFGNGHCVGGPFAPADDVPGMTTAGVANCAMFRRSDAEIRANANLIAAAPDLLAAAQAALAYLETCVEPTCDDDGRSPEANALRAAIARARGG